MTKKNRKRQQPQTKEKRPPICITGAINSLPEKLTSPDVSCNLTSPAPLLIKTDELAALLSLSKSSVERAVAAGIIPGRVVIGRQVRYHRQTVETWLLSTITKPS